MPGQPTKQGNWGDWATIHSDATDSIQRQNDEFTAPLSINQLKRLPGIECAYAKNVSDQIILCQNGRSQYSGGKCPGKCPLYKEDWSHVNALIEDKPHHMCAYCNHSGDIYTCLYHHQKTVRCSSCKAPNQDYKRNPEKVVHTHCIPVKNTSAPKDSLPDVTRFFSKRTVFVKTQKNCPYEERRLFAGTGIIHSDGKSSKRRQIQYFVCPECRRIFVAPTFLDTLHKCNIAMNVVQPSNQSNEKNNT